MTVINSAVSKTNALLVRSNASQTASPTATANSVQKVAVKSVTVSLSPEAKAITSKAAAATTASPKSVQAADIAKMADKDWKSYLTQNPLIAVSGSASEVSSILDRLQAAGTKIASIAVTGSDAALTLTAAQLKADVKTLNKISGAYNLNVTNVDAAGAAALIAKPVMAGTSVGTITSITISDTSAKIASNLAGLMSKADKISKISQSDTTGALTLTGAQMVDYQALVAKFDASVKVKATGISISDLADVLKNPNVINVGLSMAPEELATNIATLKSNIAAGKISAIVLKSASNDLALSVSDIASNADVLGKISSKFTVKSTIGQLGSVDANTLKLLTSNGKLSVSASADDVKNNYDKILTLSKNIDKITINSGSIGSINFDTAKKYANVFSLVKGGNVTVQLSGNYSQYKVVQGAGGSFVFSLADKKAATAITKETGTLAGANFFKFSDMTTFASSGDSNIDAVLNGGQNMWWFDGTGAAASADVLSNNVTTLKSGSSKTTLTYSFLTPSTVHSSASASEKAMTEMDGVQKKAVRDAFAYLSSLVNVTFSEITDAKKLGTADINLGMNVQKSSAGYANPPHASGAHNSYLFLASNQTTNSTFGLGTYGWETLVHEIGHTMGLKHPFNGNAGGGGSPQPYLPAATNNHNFSVMSYTDASNTADVNINFTSSSNGGYSFSYTAGAVNPSTYMTYDIAALQYLYGQNTNEKQTAVTFGADFKGIKTIYAPVDGSIDASPTNNNNIFDLRGGGYSTIGYSMQDQVTAQLKAQNASDTQIASVLSNAGLKKVIANGYNGQNTVGLAYGSHISSITGGSAKDQFYVNGQDNVTIDGGGGTEDTVYLAGAASDWQFAEDLTALASAGGTISGKTVLTNGTETVTLQNVEKYAFYSLTDAMTHTS